MLYLKTKGKALACTFACSVRPSEHRALLYTPERFEHLSDVSVRQLLPQHAHKQLPVYIQTDG